MAEPKYRLYEVLSSRISSLGDEGFVPHIDTVLEGWPSLNKGEQRKLSDLKTLEQVLDKVIELKEKVIELKEKEE